MNSLQRLLSNTMLAFVSNTIAKFSASLLFIFVGRQIGPDAAGVFNLGITYYTILMALSTWGLEELLVREVAPRRAQSALYTLNYTAIRLMISVGLYAGLLLFLQFNLPYTAETGRVLLIMSLAIFPEAVYSLLQALFVAYEELAVPTLSAMVNSVVRLGAGLYLLNSTQSVEAVAWVLPLSTAVSLLVFPLALVRLYRRYPQDVRARLSAAFSRRQLAFVPGFVLISVFTTLNFQIDTLLISFLMSEADIGFYGASQTILAGFLMIPAAIRTALYPLMARYKVDDEAKLAQLYRKSLQYLTIASLPVSVAVTFVAGPIIFLVFGEAFAPAVPALQWSVWALVFAVLTVPSARLMLVYNRQTQAGWLRGLGMLASVGLNLLLIPPFGIVGAATSRFLATAAFFFLAHFYVQRQLMQADLLRAVARPLLASVVMAAVMWLLRDVWFVWQLLAGLGAFSVAIVLLGGITAEDRWYLRRLFSVKPRAA